MDEIVQLNKKDLYDMLRDSLRHVNDERRLRIISRNETMERLNVNRTALSNLMKESGCCLKKARGKKGFLESSVNAEILRLIS